MSVEKFFARNLLLMLFFFGSSCVKDVELDQTQDISLQPAVALDLVHFSLSTGAFSPVNTNGPRLAREVVNLDFISEDYIQEDLVRADLNFRVRNTFNRTFLCDLIFLSEKDKRRYRISFLVPEGSTESPSVLDYTEILEGKNLKEFKKARKMQVKLEMLSGSEEVQGQLQMKSSAILKIEL